MAISQRVGHVDVARGVVIMLVPWFHFARLHEMPGFALWGGVISTFFMVAFFLYSGMFFRPSAPIRRMRRLVVPFAWFLVIPFALHVMWSVVKGTTPDWSRLLDLVRWGTPRTINPPLWFLMSLMEVILLFYPVTKCVRRRCAVLVVGIAMSLAGYLMGKVCEVPYMFDVSLLCTGPYAVGFCFRDCLLARQKSWVGVCSVVVALACWHFCPGGANVSTNDIPMGYALFAGLSLGMSLCVLWVSWWLDKLPYVGGALRFFGENSLVVLVTFVMLLPVADRIGVFVSSPLLANVIGVVVVMLAEAVLIVCINRHAGFLLAKKGPVRAAGQ